MVYSIYQYNEYEACFQSHEFLQLGNSIWVSKIKCVSNDTGTFAVQESEHTEVTVKFGAFGGITIL